MSIEQLQRICAWVKLTFICEQTGLSYHRMTRKVAKGIDLTVPESDIITGFLKTELRAVIAPNPIVEAGSFFRKSYPGTFEEERQ